MDSAIAVVGVLLVTLWGAFAKAMTPYSTLNEIKKAIMSDTISVDNVHHYRSMLRDDWTTMNLGTLVFLLLIAILVFSIPWVGGFTPIGNHVYIHVICYLTALLPFYGVFICLRSRFKTEYPMMDR